MIDENSERSKRQQECVRKWIEAGCRAAIEASTGFGKTRVGILAIKKFLSKNPNRSVLVIVPTEVLKEQWSKLLDSEGLSFNCEVSIINSALKHNKVVDFLIIDEIHRIPANSFINIFKVIKYGMILGLTATFERLDGREKLLNSVAPIVDSIKLSEAVSKGWVSKSRIYKVILQVDDINVYKEYNKQFLNYFSYFDFDWNIAMGCVTNVLNRTKFVREKLRLNKSGPIPPKDELLYKTTLKECTAIAYSWNRALQARKQFIFKHPKKLEIAEKILAARPNAKAITFNATISECEKFKSGYIVHSGKKKKENQMTLEEFNKLKVGVIHSSKSLNEGVDVKGLNLAIILHNTSSSTERIQKYGRVIRAEEGKVAEIFSLVIDETVEMQWFKKSAKNTEFIEINESQLDDVLNYRPLIKDYIIQDDPGNVFTF